MAKPKWKKGAPKHQKTYEYQENTIYVYGIEETTTEEELRAAFSGNILNVFMAKNKKFAFIKFECSEDVEGALCMVSPQVKGTSVFVEKSRRDRDENDCVLKPEVLTQLKDCVNVYDQMRLIQTELQCTEVEKSTHERIRSTLQEVLGDFFPECTVKQVYSLPNGIKGWVCNFNVNLALDKEHDKEVLDNYPKRETPNLEGLEGFEIKDEMITWESLKKSNAIGKLKYIQRILNKHCGSDFSDVYQLGLKVHAGKLPGLKTIHLASGTRVSIIINNRVLEIHDQLLRCYSELDPRVAPLMYTIQYWSENNNGGDQSRFILTKYSTQMLVVGFLSSIQPPIIPSVEQLSKLADEPETAFEVDYSVQTNSSKIAHDCSLNTLSMAELLCGFFDFCSQLDFTRSQKVMDVRSGQWITKEQFESLKPTETKKLEQKTIVVLDPFVRTGPWSFISFHNNRALHPTDVIIQFITSLTKVRHEHFSQQHPTPSGEWGLAFLFSKDTQLHSQLMQSSQILQHHVPLLRSSEFSFPVYLPQDILQTTDLPPGFTDRWFHEIQQFLMKCLTDILLLKMEKINNPPLKKDFGGREKTHKLQARQQQIPGSGKRKNADENNSTEVGDTKKIKTDNENTETGNVENKKTEEESAVVTEEEEKEVTYFEPENIVSVYKCSALFRTWTNRKSFKKSLDEAFLKPHVDEFTKEKQITHLMTSQQTAAVNPMIEGYLTFIKVAERNCIEIHMHPTAGIKEFTTFFLYLVSLVTKVVGKSFTMEL